MISPSSTIVTIVAIIAAVLLASHTATAQTCTGGTMGSCVSGSVSNAPAFCAFDCICDSASSTANVTFEASCNLVRLNNTRYHRNSTFVWFAIDTKDTAAEQALLVLNNTGNTTFPAFNWAYNGSVVHTAFATQLADMTNHTAFHLSVALTSVTKMQTTFTGGAMQCAPSLGPSLYTPTQLTGSISWLPPDTFNTTYASVDLMQRNFSTDGSNEWVLMHANVAPWNGRQFSFPDFQCNSIELAFRSTLNLPAPFTDAVRCPEMSSSAVFSVSLPPTQPSTDKIELTKQSNGLYTVAITWRTSAAANGCPNITYAIGMYSLYVRQWYAEMTVSLTALDSAQYWLIPDAELIKGIEYQVIISPRTSAGQGSQYYSEVITVDGSDSSSGSKTLSTGAIVGIAVGCGVAAVAVVGLACMFMRRRRRHGFSNI